MTWSLDFSPLVPEPVLWVGGAIALLLVALLMLRGSRGALLRALALAAVIAALANPTLRQEQRESLANIALVVMDQSTSQTIAKRPEQARAIRDKLEAKLGAISNLDVRWITASRPTGQRSGTHLFDELNRALANTPTDRLAGVILITDGQIHDIPKSSAALGFDAPIHTILTGRPNEFDRRIEIIQAPRFGIVGQKRSIIVAVRETGKKGRAADIVSLKVRREGQPDEIRRVQIGRRAQFDMAFPHAGTNIVEIELATAPGELTPVNNRVVIAAQGVRDNLRVLLVSGEPHAGERTWRNLLKSDAAVDLVHFTILRPPEKRDGTPIHELSLIAFPTQELFSEKINDFDLIIFDRYQRRGILNSIYYDNMARYVEEHGGAILVAAGSSFAGARSIFRTPLARILPAVPTGRVLQQPYKPTLASDGRKHPVTRALPGSGGKTPRWGRWFRQIQAIPQRGRTLMSGINNEPLLLLDRVGKGRVAMILSDHPWLWARGFEGGGPHTNLLRRIAHWSMKEPDLEEERLMASAKGLKLTIERRSMEARVPPVRVQGPGGDTQTVELEKKGEGVWRLTLDVKRPGLYKMQSGELTAVAHAGIADQREMSEVTATPDKLSDLQAATGGGAFWTLPEVGLLTSASVTNVSIPRVSVLTAARVLHGSGWLGLKDRQAYVTQGVKLIPMFNGLIALAGLLGLIALMWWREGR
ncbi:MAG: hypothetical protein AAFR04_00245 [Pseudomonadota bacterium]